MKEKQYRLSFKTILFGSSIGIFLIVIILFAFFCGSMIHMINGMQARNSKYLQLGNLLTRVQQTKTNYEKLFSAFVEGDDKALYEYTQVITELQKANQQDAKDLGINYNENEEKYFISNSIINTLSYLEKNQLTVVESTKSLSQESYTQYYWILKVYDYLIGYIVDNYLRTSVVLDSQYFSLEVKRASVLTSSAIIFISLITFIAFTISSLSTRSIVRSLNKIVQTAIDIRDGNFETEDLKPSGPKELKMLGERMNKMKHSIKNGLEIERKLHIKETEHLKMSRELDVAKYRTLQAQINPHFLFNTLNLISHTALFEKASKTVKLTNSFASFLRYSFEFKDEVTIESEINFVKQFMTIQKARFSDRISYSIEYDKQIAGFFVPPLIIQPFVENAIIHGFGNKEDGGRVDIKVYKQDENVIISILDDGVGINEDSANKGRVGILNVKERLMLYFKAKAKLEIKRVSEEGGTLVLMVLPMNARGKDEIINS